MKVDYNARNKLIKIGKYTSKSMHNVYTISWILLFPVKFY